MKPSSLLAFSALSLLALGSCSPKIYFPERTNAPMLREAGEVKLTSSLKLQNNSAGSKNSFSPSLDFAFSPIQGLGIMGSFRGTSRYADEDDFGIYQNQDSIYYSGNKGEFGLGYYLPFGRKGLFEVYAGGAFGNGERQNLRQTGGDYKTKYYQVFIQPELGFNANDIFELSGGIRFNYHKYSYFQSPDPNVRYYFTDPQTDIKDNYFLFVCPFINFNVGYRFVKFNAQFGLNGNIGRPRLILGNSPWYASMGLTFGFAPRFLRK